ncbi:MAG TPA: hypothetical protein VMB79_16565 [Jatrophihabitans sp.]|nr:hypothetical protein [Jatrophihabitans sp.]
MRTLTMQISSPAHVAPVTSVDLSGDRRLMASGSYDGSVLIWDVGEPDRPRRLARLAHRRLVNAVAWNPYRPAVLATASADKTVAVWDLADPAEPRLLSVSARHTDDINSVAWMPDGERFVCVSEDGRASLWQADRFEGLVASHAAHCMMVDVSPAGLVATVGEDGLVAVTDPRTGSTAERKYDGSVEGCRWSHGGELLAIARDDGYVDVLDADLQPRLSTKVASSAARSVAWSDDDRMLVVGAYDGGVHLVSAADGDKLQSVSDPRFWPRAVAAAGGLVAVGSFWNAPHLLDLQTLATVCDPAGPTEGANALAARAGSDELLVGTDSGAVLTVAGASTGGPLIASRVDRVTRSPILSLAVRDERTWAGTYDGHVHLVVPGARQVSSINLGAPIPSLLAVGDRLVAGTYNGELVELDAATLAIRHRSGAHDGSVKSLAAGSGEAFLSAATDRTVRFGDLDRRAVLWEHGNLVNAVATDASGTVVASASRDHTVKAGRLGPDGGVTGPVLTLLGADESIKTVLVLGSPEAPVVVAGSYDFGLYAWPIDWSAPERALRTGERIGELGQGVSTSCLLTPDLAAVVGWDGSLVLLRQAGGRIEQVATVPVPHLLAECPSAKPAATEEVSR